MAKKKTADEPSAPIVGAQGTALAAIRLDAAAQGLPMGEQILRIGFDTAGGFDQLQRVSKPFNLSKLVPTAFQGPDNFSDCLIAVEMATRMGASPLMVMQNLYIVHGKPSWSSQFLIATFNSCGRFGPIKYRQVGEPGTDSYGYQATSYETKTGDILEGPPVTIGMAKKENWYSKNGSKWLTMPELMLRYRAATFLVRVTAPEIGMGLSTTEELYDIGEVAPPAVSPKKWVGAVEAVEVKPSSLLEPEKEVKVANPEPEHTDAPEPEQTEESAFD